MAKFDKVATKVSAYQDVTGILAAIRTTYAQMKRLQGLLTRYNAGLDTEYIGAVNTMFTAADKTELGTVLTKINSLVTDLETNHREAIGL
jgi:hypothetical protein